MDVTGLLLKVEEDTKVRLPFLPPVGTEQVLPRGARIILPRDSIDLLNVETVGDVVASIAGTYLWRGGWLGRAEPANYLGRGATSVEYVVDGVPYIPLGADSVSVDPSIFPLGFVDRIEVERLPGLLRVHLLLREQRVLAPWSRLTVDRGTYDLGRYEGLIQRRTRRGLGYTVGGSYSLFPEWAEGVGDFQVSYGWLEASYVPTGKAGAHLRYLLTMPERDPAINTESTARDTLTREIDGTRGDLEARLSLRQRDDGLGSRADFLVTRSTWSSDSVDQSLWRFGLVTSHRSPVRSLGLSAWYGTRWTRLDTRATAGWTPIGRVSLAVEGAYQAHRDSRTSKWLLVRAGVSLVEGLTVAGSWRVGSAVARPTVAADRAQHLSDRDLSLELRRPRYGASVTYTRLAGYQPVPYYQFTAVDSIARSGETEWLTVTARLAPRQWFTLQGWFSDPLGTGPEGIPPRHSMVTAAVQSKFLRTFPSGIFNLKLALSAENWSAGTLGRGPTGDPVTIDGATFLRALIEMQFGDFQIYYDRPNLGDVRSAWVPGFRIPLGAAFFGVRWAFLN